MNLWRDVGCDCFHDFSKAHAPVNLLTSFSARCQCQRREHLRKRFTKKPNKLVLPNAAARQVFKVQIKARRFKAQLS
jgi:hypothetical protein